MNKKGVNRRWLRAAVISLLVCFVLLSGSLLAGCSKKEASNEGSQPATDTAKEPIKVGVLTDLVGAWAPRGISLANNAKLAAKEINDAGGVLGRPIELIIEDSATDPKTGVEKARKLVEQDKVAVVVGSISSAMRNAVKGTIADRNNTLLLYPELYEGNEVNKNIFCFGPVPAQTVDKFMPWLMNKYGKRVYFVGMDYVWPRETNKLARVAVEQNGGQVVGEEYLPSDAQDFSAVIGRIKAAKADVLFQTYPGTGITTFLKQIKDFGLKITVANDVMGEESLVGVPNDVVEGQITSLDYFLTVPGKENEDYLKRMQDMFGDEFITQTTGVGAYNGLRAWAQAANEAGSIETDAVREKLNTVKLATSPTGPIEMAPDEHHMVLNVFYGVVENGKFNIVESLGKMQPKQPKVPK